MDTSILTTIKKMLGISEDDTAFDTDIINYINMVMFNLKQLGVIDNFVVTGKNDYWSDFVPDENLLGTVQTYIYSKVRMIFDPPTGAASSALTALISELEWRLNVEVDPEEE